jgi:hypothetical protein
MAGVGDTKVIDLVGEGPDGEVITYAGFVADGSLVRQYPDLERRPVRIQIDCPEQPTDAIAALLDQAAPSLSEFGISLSLYVRGYGT